MKILRTIAALVLAGAMLTITGCQQAPIQIAKKDKPVEVSKIALESKDVYVAYTGHVAPLFLKKYSFASGGVVQEIRVKEGDVVAVGTPLATLKVDKLDIAVGTAASQQKAAQGQYSKASTAVAHVQKSYDDLVALSKASVGSVSQKQIDDVKLQLDLAKRDQEMAYAQLAQAKLQSEYQKSNKADAVMVSDMNGVVMQVANEPGELVGSGYPVVIVASAEHVVQVGLKADQVHALKDQKENLKVMLRVEDKAVPTTLKSIAVVPDSATQTYLAEFTVPQDLSLLVGESVDLTIFDKTIKGIWLPIASIMNDGQDYVYLVEDNMAVRRPVTILEMVDDQVAVEGLKVGEALITSGTLALAHGYPVVVVEGKDE